MVIAPNSLGSFSTGNTSAFLRESAVSNRMQIHSSAVVAFLTRESSVYCTQRSQAMLLAPHFVYFFPSNLHAPRTQFVNQAYLLP